MALISFNRVPYFDSYTDDKNYSRVVFKPSLNIQVRELNEMQSIFVSQIRKFAGNVFKNGSRVKGGNCSYIKRTYIVLAAGDDAMQSIHEGSAFTCDGVHYTVTSISEKMGLPVITYAVTSMSDNDLFESMSGKIVVFDDVTLQVIEAGTLNMVVVGAGTFYYDGYFMDMPAQHVTTSYNGAEWSGVVGLTVVDEIITSDDDASLVDNATSSRNVGAPGADRYKIQLKLTKRSATNKSDGKFIPVAEIRSGELVTLITGSEYAQYGDMLAKRTHEESGNYSLGSFNIRVTEHLKTPSVDGVSTDGSIDNYALVVDPIISYVEGYRQQVLTEQIVIAPKLNSTLTETGLTAVTHAPYMRVHVDATNSATNHAALMLASDAIAGQFMNLRGVPTGPLPSGALLGTVRVRSVEIESGVPGAGNVVYRYHVDAIHAVKGMNVADTVSIECVLGPCGVVLDAINIQESHPRLISLVNATPIKTLRTNNTADSGIAASVNRTAVTQTDSAGNVTITVIAGERFNQATAPIVSKDMGGTYKTVPSSVIYTGNSAIISTAELDADIMITHDVFMDDVSLKTKTFQTFTETITSISAKNDLNVYDVISITSATLIKKVGGTETDVKRFTTFDSGQRDTYYTNASVTCAVPGLDLSLYDLRITGERFSHAGTGVFTVDSYHESVHDRIPTHVTSNNQQVKLSSVIDYRDTVLNGNMISKCMVITSDELIRFGAVSYLPRIDTLVQDRDGMLSVKTGKPAIDAVAPVISDKYLAIADLRIPAYTQLATDIVPVMRSTKRYTMKDINGIENRISNMEYYTSMSLLEKSASDMSIKDVNGLDRFKNGFIVDDFSKYQAADVHSSEFRSALDRKSRELRPSFKARNRKAVSIDSIAGKFANNNNVITLPFVEEVADSQPRATKMVSINSYFFANRVGQMELTPNVDTWADTTWAPNISFTVDSGAEEFKKVGDRTKVLGTEWGAWNVANRSTVAAPDTASTVALRVVDPSLKPATTIRDASVSQATTVTTTTNWTRAGTTFSSGSKVDAHSWDNVTDVTIEPYCRSTQIRFKATNLSAATKFYLYFDQTNITEFAVDSSTGQTGSIVSTDSGEAYGTFTIPEKTFFVGEKEVVLSTVPYYEQVGADGDYCTSRSAFFAGGINMQRQEIDMQVITPTWMTKSEPEQKRVTVETVQVLPPLPPAPPPAPPPVPAPAPQPAPAPAVFTWPPMATPVFRFRGDPIAQSFILPKDRCITSIDLWFATIDKLNSDFWVSIRRVENGIPVSDDLQVKWFNTEDVVTSSDASLAFNAKFDYPVFVEGGKEYCFVVGGWSPDTRLWFGKLGDTLINDPDTVVDVLSDAGSAFRSQNGVTWTPEMYEDFKYKIYVAKFDTDVSKPESDFDVSMTLISEREALPEDPFECETGSDVIRVYYPDHGMVAGDAFEISMFEDTIYSIKVDAGKPLPQINSMLYAQNGRGMISSIETDTTNNKVAVQFKNITGYMLSGEKYSTESFQLNDSRGKLINNVFASTGTIEDANIESLAGIPVSELVGSKLVMTADSPDSFLFKIGGALRPTSSGRFGGKNVFIEGNFKYDVFNFSGNYMLYGASETWTYHGTGHNPDGGIFESKNYVEQPGITFTPSTDVHMDVPLKFAGAPNTSKVKSGHSVKINAKFKTNDVYKSPIINLATFSNTMISNRVSWMQPDKLNVKPNSVDRFIDETAFNGSEPYKYVTKHVTLKNPASDIKIMVDIYKDKDADFDVYYKVVHVNSTAHIDAIEWIHIPVEYKVNCTSVSDMREYEIVLSEAFGASYIAKEFNTFKVKLVGKSNNSAKPPIFKNLRVVAIT